MLMEENASTVAELLLVRHVVKGLEVGISLLVSDEGEQPKNSPWVHCNATCRPMCAYIVGVGWKVGCLVVPV